MNNLSWLIYLADVAGSISTVGTLISVGSFIGGVVVMIGMATDYPSRKNEAWPAAWPFFKWAIIAALIVTPIPSKSSLYAIAASEMGEEVIKSETAGKAMKALDAWLDRQIAPEKAESDPS